MPLTSLRIFVACPADVNPERERLYTTVEDLKELAQHFDVTVLGPVHWDPMASLWNAARKRIQVRHARGI
jgi:hypothetical protein